VSSSECFWPILYCFSSDFLSQIYARPPISTRHAPLSRVFRCRLLLLPVAQVTPYVGVRCVACTRQRVLFSLAHVTATFRHFWPCTVGMGSMAANLRLGDNGDGACSPRAAVSDEVRLCLLCRHCVVFSACVFCYGLPL